MELSVCVRIVLFTIFVTAAVVDCSNIGATRQDITLDNDGGFIDILIAIHDDVAEDRGILSSIEYEFRAASNFFQSATNGNLYFKEISILVPRSWTPDATWTRSTDESVDTARVIVGPQNPAYGDVPYTLQPGLCGQEADYIHLTPDYIKSEDVSLGKRLVREFAHLRWGVFDEDVPDSDTISPRFYAFNRRVYPTKCTQDILGTIGDPTQPKGGCLRDFTTGLPTSTCIFTPSQSTTSTASIMYAEWLNSVSQFCENSTDISEFGDITHDNLAPNRQNRICDDNVRAVLSGHSDFSSPYAADRLVTPDTEFTILHPTMILGPQIPVVGTTTDSGQLVVNTSIITGSDGDGGCDSELVCLTLDKSGSMASYDRINKMRIAVSTYILNHLPDGTILAVTQFENSALQLSAMTNITSDAVRNYLVSTLPTAAGGGTNIANGMELCRQVLVSYAGGEDKVAGARILLLSDGQGHIGSTDLFVAQGITIDTIAYSQAADPGLSAVSDATGGLKYFTGDNDAAVGLQDALLATVQRDCDSGLTTLINEQITLINGQDTIIQSIYIDSTLGDDTKLTFSYSVDINVNVTTPDGQNYTITKDEALKLITVQIHGPVTGEVMYELSRANPTSTEDITVTITSKPIDGVDAIEVNFRTDETNIQFSPMTIVAGYAEIFQGMTPILGLTVTTVISTPQSDDVSIELFDNGVGLDSTPNDGIYTGVLTANQMAGDGYYNIRVFVSGEGFLPAGPALPTPEPVRRKKRNTGTSIGQITRTTSGGYLSIDNFYYSGDVMPPSKITDLSLVAALRDQNTFRLSWSSPGDDFFQGTVSGYDFRVSNSRSRGYVTLPLDSIISNLTELIQAAGTKVEIVIDISLVNNTIFGVDRSEEIDTYYFRVRAVDENGNEGELSNTVSASFVDPELFEYPILVGEIENGTDVYKPLVPATTTTQKAGVTDTQVGDKKGGNAVVAGVVPVILLLLIAAVIGIVLFIKMKKRKIHASDEYLTYFEDGEEKPSTPPRHTTFMQDERTPAAERSSSKKMPGKNPKALPKIRGAQPKK